MDIQQLNAYEIAKDKPIEYFQKPNFMMMLKVITNRIQPLYDTIYKLRFDRVLDNAYGELLDILGELVGEPRAVSVEIYDGIFTFAKNPFGEWGFDVGKFSSSQLRPQGSIVRDDTVYRLAIKAKILTNIGSGTPEEIITICKLLTNSNKAIYREVNGGVRLLIDTDTDSLLMSYAFKFIQKALPVGVNLLGIKKVLVWDVTSWDESFWYRKDRSKFDVSKWDKAYWEE